MKNTKFLILTVSAFAFQLVAHATTLTGTYEVPLSSAADTADTSLQDASQFEIDNITFLKFSDGTTKIKYVLPQELTGQPNLIKIKGKIENGVGQLSSEYNKMDCVESITEVKCDVEFKKLNFDQSKVQEILATKFVGADLQNHQVVQQIFSTDPVGIFRIHKPILQSHQIPSF